MVVVVVEFKFLRYICIVPKVGSAREGFGVGRKKEGEVR